MILVIAAYSDALLRGRATKVPQVIERVLVVQTAKMGDMVCATPVLHALRMRFPQARITVYGDAVGKEILADSADVDAYIVQEKNIRANLQQIRAGRFDACLVLVPDAHVIALAFLAGIPLVVAPKIVGGFCPWQTKTYRLLLKLVQSAEHRMGHYAPREYLKTLEPLGIETEDTTKHLAFSEAARKNMLAFLRAHDLVEKQFAIISPSAGNKIKNWPAERFSRVAEHVVAQGLSVVVIGGSRDSEEVKAMLHELKTYEHIIDASNQFSIDELKAVISCAALLVAVDTGPIYIAEAFSVATVDSVGPMDEREQPPVGQNHLVVVAPRAAPAIHVMNARVYDEREARRQIEDISIEMVCSAIDSLV